jgi:O-antigen/teichoic acid export membrane protein
MSLASGSALLLGGRVLEYLAVGIAGVLVARGLGPEGRGVYSLVNQASAWSVAFVVPGLADAAVYLWGRRRYDLRALWGNYLAWWVGVMALLSAGALAVLAVGRPLLGMAPWQLSLALGGGMALLLYEGAQTLALGQGMAGRYVLAQVTAPLLRLAGIAALFVLGTGLAAVLGVWVGALLVACALAVALARLPLRPSLDLAALRHQLAYGAKGFAGWMLAALNHRLDVFIVGGLLGAAAVGRYTVAFNAAELSWWVPLAVGSVLFPKASSLPPDVSAQLAVTVCRRTLLVAALAIACLGSAGYILIPLLYGEEFRQSVSAFYVLLPSGLFYSVSKVLGSSLWALGRPQVGVYSGLASAPVMLALNFLLVPHLGIEGAALASMAAYLLNAAVVLAVFSRATATPWWRPLLPEARDLRALAEGGASLWRRRPLADLGGDGARPRYRRT